MLTGFWYRALPADHVHRNQLHQAMLLEVPLVIGRDRQDKAFALRDACPHRAMPSTAASSTDKTSSAPTDGWTFDAHNGQCQLIPSLTADQNLKVDRIYCRQLPLRRAGWLCLGIHSGAGPAGRGIRHERRSSRTRPSDREVRKTSSDKYRLAYLTADMPVSIDHGIIGLMDPAHGPFVHQAWWWRSRHSIHEKKKNFEPIPNGFRMSAHTPSSNSAPYKLLRLYAAADSITTTIEFVLPNLRKEIIRAGKYWFSSLTTVTPITRNQCRIDVVAAWNIFRWLPFGSGSAEVRFCQVRRAGPPHHGTASEGLRAVSDRMLIDDADRPAKRYFGLKAAYLEANARAAGDEAPHGRSGHAEVEKLVRPELRSHQADELIPRS